MEVLLANLLGYLFFPALGLGAMVVLYITRRLEPEVFFDAPPRSAGLSLIDLFVGLWIMLAAAALLLRPVILLFGIPITTGTPGEPTPTLRQSALIPLISQTITQLPIVLFILWRAARVHDGLRELGAVPRRPGREMLAGILALLAALPMVLGSSNILFNLAKFLDLEAPTVGHELLKNLLDSTDPVATGLMIASAVLVAPVLEEFVFRGLVQTALLHWLGPARRWLIVFLAAGLFAAVHGSVASWHVLPGLFILGLVLGWLYEKYGSLLPGIVLHMLFNLANIGLGMLQGE